MIRIDRSSVALAFAASLSGCLAISSTASANPSVAVASEIGDGHASRIGSVCLRERVILRPKRIGSVDSAEPGERIELVRETICDNVRRLCSAGDLCR